MGTLKADWVPRLVDPPADIELVRVVPKGPPTQLAPGVWQRAWEVSLAVRPTPDLTATPMPRRLLFTFTEDRALAYSTASLPVVISRVQGIESPRTVHFGTIQSGQTLQKRLVLRAADGRDFRIVKVSTDCTAFEVQASTTKLSTNHLLEVAFHAKTPGSAQATLTVETDHPDSPRINIDAVAIVPEPGS
jgi:hypothetical protein